MKGINHLVIAGNSLNALRETYSSLGFTLTPPAQHPFGTGNCVIQLHGSYLELLAVTRPADVVEHGQETFSFPAFNRDYLKRHEGFSMVVFDSEDAAADREHWSTVGLATYAPFAFSRLATMPDGQQMTLGFSLAFTRDLRAPWLGVFACQHYNAAYYQQAKYLSHPNAAWSLHDVWITGTGATTLASFLETVADSGEVTREAGLTRIATAIGTIVLAEPARFEKEFGFPPLHSGDGPHLAAFGVACNGLASLPAGVTIHGERHIVPVSRTHGAVVSFVERAAS